MGRQGARRESKSKNIVKRTNIKKIVGISTPDFTDLEKLRETGFYSFLRIDEMD